MKRKIIAFACVLIAVMICTSCASVNELLGRTISKKKVESYLNDSLDAVAYLFAYDPDYADKQQLDGDLKVRLSAATYKARTKDIESDDRTYLIPKEEMNKEIASVFSDTDISDFKNNDFISLDDNGIYHLLNGDWGDAGPVYKITDEYYGINGSEPTQITVRYTFFYGPDEEEMNDRYDYEAHFTLVGDKESIYSFKVTDFSGKNLVPVKNVKEIASSEVSLKETEETVAETESETAADNPSQGLKKEDVDGKGDIFFDRSEMPYVEIIEKHKKAIKEGWDAEDYTKEKMSYLFKDCKSEDEVGFCLKYMDDSTYPWMFVGTMVGEPYVDDMILDAYSLDENGDLIQQFSGWERNRYYYMESGEKYPMIANEGSSGAALSDYYYFEVQDGKLKLKDAVIYDGFTDEKNPWFYVNGADVEAKNNVLADGDMSWPYDLGVPMYEASDGKPVSEEKANEIIDAYQKKYRRLDLRPLTEGYEILSDPEENTVKQVTVTRDDSGINGKGTYGYHFNQVSERDGKVDYWGIDIYDENGKDLHYQIEAVIDPDSIYIPEAEDLLYEADINSDGLMDIVVFKGVVGAQGVRYDKAYIMTKDSFEEVTGFDEIPNAYVVTEDGKIHGDIRDGAAAYYEMLYEIDGSRVKKISETRYEYDTAKDEYVKVN